MGQWRRWLVAGAISGVVGLLLALGLFVFPVSSPPAPADAVFLLGGDASTRLPLARRLAEEGPGVLVVSVAEGPDNAAARALCDTRGAVTVLCFTAEEPDTRGEARAIGRIVAEHGWTRITVVTNRYHVTRAGLLVRRCTDAEVQMAGAATGMPFQRWLRAVFGETVGLGAAAVDWSC